ncbi:MAG: argininosuccinate synthase [Planctomycetota bacterium]|nr:argininosuccinate synthase [Planctomycetota bacterium]MCX8039063.1 argininosuccinate synthase [Planctomycetota bacterium]MDW8373782.1 argininosuccinate synthase [Planctomycetota bacterium]
MNSPASRPRVVLAYSGGLDTSVIVRWLTERGYAVICFCADVGQREDFSTLERKALASGAVKCVIRDVREEFVRDFVFPAIAWNARYEGRYLLGTSLARPVIAKHMVEIARQEGAEYIAHGATGKGNDQVRFELTAYALYPGVKIIAPWRDPAFRAEIPGRAEAIAYAQKWGIPVKATVDKPWSSDDNLMHISFEAGMLEDPAQRPLDEMWERTLPLDQVTAPREALSIDFEQGRAVAVNGRRLSPAALLAELNEIGCRHGVGRIDIVESRFVGMKSRGVYETPGGTILLAAHQDLEALTVSRDLLHTKSMLAVRFSQMVYFGLWYTEEMEALMAFLEVSQRHVTGRVRLELLKGNVIITGRESEHSLYDAAVASMEADGGAYDQSDATGFIKLQALPLRVAAQRAARLAAKRAREAGA